jgi:hypothetical protein
MDGSCLPPVIFVPSKPKDGQRYITADNKEAMLLHIEGLGAPSSASTLAWLNAVTRRGADYFEDSPHIILDSLRGHFAPTVEEKWENIKATTHRLPATLGRWLNPCDQSINREMRREFTRLQMDNRNAKLDNIVRAYYSVKESTVINSFKKCGLFGGKPEDVIDEVAREGYSTAGARHETLEACRVAFTKWATSSVRRPSDLLPRSTFPAAAESGLDGRYWGAAGTSRPHGVAE